MATEQWGDADDRRIKAKTYTMEADFVDITEEDEKEAETLLPALKYEMPRHKLMEGKVTEAAKTNYKEMELDEKLGLKNQAKITGKTQLQADIDDLTNSKDYHEISAKQLSQLFQINKLQSKCHKINLKNHVTAFLEELKENINPVLLTIFISTSILSYVLWQYTNWKTTTWINWWYSFDLLAILGFGIALIGTTFEKFSYSYQKIKIDLLIAPIEQTDIKLPYGVKLKVSEAMDTDIFERFVVASPDLKRSYETHHIEFPFKDVDPAVLGVTTDNRMFMIAYWDIQKDIDKTNESISKFERFKIK